MLGSGRLAILALAAFSLVASCSGPPELDADTPSFGAGLRGEVEVRIVDHFDGRSERRYRLRAGDGKSRRLSFNRDPELAPGSRVTVWGDQEGGALRVTSWKTTGLADAELEVRRQPLIGAPAMPTRKMAFVLVDLGGGVNITADEARRKAFGQMAGDQSMKQVIGEYSFGRQDLTGEVVGPLKATMSGCDEDSVSDQLKAMVPGYENYVWYLGQRISACDWAGTAGLGRPGKIFPELWVNGTASCRVASHEFGHNLGLQHAARLRCTGAVLADDPGTCRSSEYGDSTDVMGDGCNHFNGYSKAYLSWFERCNGVEAKSSGTFTLLPVETACNGTQVLLVPMPKGKTRRVGSTDLQNYALELRAPIGLDAKLGPVVMVRLAAPINQMRGGRMTWILDMDPATTALDGLRQGQSFTDPAGGVSFRVEAISATSASVKVEVMGGSGGPACLDGTPFTAPGPDSCGNASEGPVVVPPDAGPPAAPDAGSGGTAGRDAGGRADTAAPDLGSGGQGGAGGGGGTPADPEPGPGTPPPGGSSFTSTAPGCRCGLGGAGSVPAGVPLLLLLGALGVRRLRRRS